MRAGTIPGQHRGRRPRWRAGILVLGALLVVAATLVWLNWSSIAEAFPGGRPADANTLLPSSADQITQARALLDQLPVGARPEARSGYRRSAFGDAWTDTDGNGCNQRDDVLLRDVVKSAPFTVGRQRGCDHDLLAGTWVDPYTGNRITLTDAKQPAQAESVQIDHLVPLVVAWRYGANTWTPALRLQFANDLRNLVAAGGVANQSKGGSDAAQWRPVAAAQCGYAVRYVVVKSSYGLPTDTTEKRALADMLATCP